VDDLKARLLAALRENQSTSLTADQRVETAEPRARRQARPTCSSGKTCFTTEAAARRRLQAILDHAVGTSLYVPTTVRGPCRKCGFFHLTSKAGKRWKRGKRSRFNDAR
jgi:hypothetical protein